MLVSIRPMACSAVVAGVFIVVASAVSIAQDKSTAPLEPVELETITITADPFARTADQLVQPAEILSGEALDRRRGATLGETLEHELGVSTTDFGRGAGRPLIRGQGGPRVQVLQNGVSSMDASDVSSDHDVSIDPANADQVEILKGPATLIYGSGASAGVVNVVDQRLPTEVTQGFVSRLRAGLRSNADERSAAATLAYGVGGTQLRAEGAYLDAGNYDIPGRSAIDGSGTRGQLSNSAIDKRSGSLSAAQFWGRGSLAVAVSRFEALYGLPVEEQAFIEMGQDRVDMEGRLLKPFDGWESIRLRFGYSDYGHTEFEAPGVAGTMFDNAEHNGRIEFTHEPFAGFRGVLGVQRRQRDFQARGDESFVPPSQTRDVGVFLVEQTPTAFGSLEFGLRSDQNTVALQGADRLARSFSPSSLSAGALFVLDARHHLKLYTTRSERAPVVEELYSFGPHGATASFERGDDTFNVETANNLELSIDRHGGPLNWRVNVFYQRAADYIYQREVDRGLDGDGNGGAGLADGIADRVGSDGRFNPQGELLLLDYAADRARFWGAEGEVSHAWTIQGVELGVRVFADSVRGRIRGGQNLPRITPARFGLGLHVHRRPWSLSADFTRVQQQDRVASLETETRGYSLLAADADYEITSPLGSVRLFLRGRNLLDEEARRHTSFVKDSVPLPGASLMTGVEWRID